MHHVLRLCALAAVAITFLPANAATKNATDMSAFQGNFFGKTKVTADGETFRGRTQIRGKFAEDGLSGIFNIQGNVRVEGERVPINNRFTLRKTGRVDIDELAPAVSSGAKEKGFYTAQPRDISFAGKFRLDGSSGKIEGTYDCRIRINGQRVLRITYSVTLADDTEPSFIYKFVAKPRTSNE